MREQWSYVFLFTHPSICITHLQWVNDVASVILWNVERVNGAFEELHKLNTLRPRQNGRRFADDTFKRIFLNENIRISIKISLKFVSKGQINNNPSLVQIMAWRRSGDKPLSEPMMVRLLTHICVTRPQWVKQQPFISGPCTNTGGRMKAPLPSLTHWGRVTQIC